MGAKIISKAGSIAFNSGWKTYYVRLIIGGRDHFKFGVCHGRITNRFSREPEELCVEVLKIWEHPNEASAHIHEQHLFQTYPGDLPYIGRCGPLSKGGNGETYSHDVLNGEPPPKRFLVRMLSDDESTLYTYGYAENNPKEPYRHLHGKVQYMDYAFGPKIGTYYQVPGLSHPDTVTLCEAYLFQKYLDINHPPTKTRDIFLDAVKASICVTEWTDYYKMRFSLGYPFKPEQYAIWV